MTPLKPKYFQKELIFGNWNYQPIPSEYYNFLNHDDNDVNNNTDNPVGDALMDNKWVEDLLVTNDEDINNEIIIDDDDRLDSDIDPPPN